ncbi:hypothetical protein A4X09_0g5006 [Tilletia walkeri]|uniref:Uncharacterized protein n=1 Tax=Tilletia walkeri TaxID=117179 RepID=A0A8X7N893_9BASI|nr:hypothetical protein A4X09_0g5006 [Tilletia walkeri]
MPPYPNTQSTVCPASSPLPLDGDRFPLMKNFHPSASEAHQTSLKRERCLKIKSLYKLNPDFSESLDLAMEEGGPRRPGMGDLLARLLSDTVFLGFPSSSSPSPSPASGGAGSPALMIPIPKKDMGPALKAPYLPCAVDVYGSWFERGELADSA